MLHIHNGDSTAGTARQTDLPGEHLAWREAMICGPAPGGLPADEFLSVRAEHLASAYGVDIEKCKLELRTQEDAIARFSDHEEIVLWFEHDLFCQVHLIYLLDWFARRELGETRLSLICKGDFPGIEGFSGLGQLSKEELASLFPERQEVSQEQLLIGSQAWRAYSAPDPAPLLTLLDSDLSAMPFLARALSKHLQRFPSTTNGLGRIQHIGLELVARGYGKFKSLFPAFARHESDYGFGDAQLYFELKKLADAPAPLLRLSQGSEGASLDPAQIFLSSFEITELGRAVLEGNEDYVRKNGIDHWLGGVHLEGDEAAWRWEMGAQELLRRL